jgi:hypothetical protein
VALREWWPVELAALMAGVGVALDLQLYHRLLPYQPGWVALPLGALELGVVMALALVLGIGAPLWAAVAFFVGAWTLAQLLGHAVLPLASPSYAEDGGELGRPGAAVTVAVAVALAAAGVVLVARRWRRDAGPAVPAPDLDPADERRLDAELATFDR